MRIAVAADELTGVAETVVEALRERGHEPLPHGALTPEERDDWAWASEAAARDVAEGRAEQAVVCCWTGTGASIAANKVRGHPRRALRRRGDRRGRAASWNDANVLALSLRATSEAELAEILDAWFGGEASAEADDRANVEHLREIEGGQAARRWSAQGDMLGRWRRRRAARRGHWTRAPRRDQALGWSAQAACSRPLR